MDPCLAKRPLDKAVDETIDLGALCKKPDEPFDAVRAKCIIGIKNRDERATRQARADIPCAIRVADLLNPERFAEKLKDNLDYHNFVLTNYLKAPAVDFQKTLDDALALVPRIRPMVADVSSDLYAAHKNGASLLFEGAQRGLIIIKYRLAQQAKALLSFQS